MDCGSHSHAGKKCPVERLTPSSFVKRTKVATSVSDRNEMHLPKNGFRYVVLQGFNVKLLITRQSGAVVKCCRLAEKVASYIPGLGPLRFCVDSTASSHSPKTCK